MYLRSTAIALVGLIEQDVAILVHYPLRLSLSADEFEELVVEPGCFECELPVVFVDIEQAPLRSRVRRGFRFVDRRSDAVNVQDSGKCQPTEPGTDDHDRSIHPESFVV